VFNHSKYTTWYFQIVDRARSRTKPEGYCERHHVVPKSIGGSHDKNNLVSLTAREHVLCHYLLSKMMIEARHAASMQKAFAAMLPENKNMQRGRITSHMYQAARVAASLSSALRDKKNRFDPSLASEEYKSNMSAKLKGRSAPWRSGAKHSEEAKARMSVAKKGCIFSEEHRAKLSARAKGRVLSEHR
jgi:hypothetical protein